MHDRKIEVKLSFDDKMFFTSEKLDSFLKLAELKIPNLKIDKNDLIYYFMNWVEKPWCYLPDDLDKFDNEVTTVNRISIKELLFKSSQNFENLKVCEIISVSQLLSNVFIELGFEVNAVLFEKSSVLGDDTYIIKNTRKIKIVEYHLENNKKEIPIRLNYLNKLFFCNSSHYIEQVGKYYKSIFESYNFDDCTSDLHLCVCMNL